MLWTLLSCFRRVSKKQRIYHLKLASFQPYSASYHTGCSHMSPFLVQVHLKASKTDQFKQSPHVPGKIDLCAVIALLVYMASSPLVAGLLFATREGHSLTKPMLVEILKIVLERAGFKPQVKVCFHKSFRLSLNMLGH